MQYTEVSFESGDLTLSGMLFLPKGNDPFPVAVIIHGSGTSRRNSPWYLTVTKHLQENGIAVLLPDKRGSEKSEGDWTKATFCDLAGDTISALDFIKTQTAFEHSKIGVIGFSQGGWITPIVATESENLAFLISMSGAGVTTDDQLLHEEVNNITDLGTWRFIAELAAPFVVHNIKKSQLWSKIGGFDPISYWQKVNVPAFMAFGENDKNVPVEASLRRIQALNKSNITLKVYPEGGHGIIDPITHRVQEECLHDLVDFIGTSKITR
jgi:dipeptidyl aminopeptidase/acylaminoacyl peptidase